MYTNWLNELDILDLPKKLNRGSVAGGHGYLLDIREFAFCERSRLSRSLDAKQVRVPRPRAVPPGDASRVIGEARSIALSRQRLRRCACRGLQPYCREQPARLGSRGSREQRSLSDTIEFDQYGRLIKASLINLGSASESKVASAGGTEAGHTPPRSERQFAKQISAVFELAAADEPA